MLLQVINRWHIIPFKFPQFCHGTIEDVNCFAYLFNHAALEMARCNMNNSTGDTVQPEATSNPCVQASAVGLFKPSMPVVLKRSSHRDIDQHACIRAIAI